MLTINIQLHKNVWQLSSMLWQTNQNQELCNNKHIYSHWYDTLSVQWHPRWVFSLGLQDCSFASWLCETLLLYAFSSLHCKGNHFNTWRLRYLLLCSWLYKDSPNNGVQFGIYCIHIMVIFKHVFLLFLFWMWIKIPRRHPSVCVSTGMATNRSWERGQFGGQHVGHPPWCGHSASHKHKDCDIWISYLIQHKNYYNYQIIIYNRRLKNNLRTNWKSSCCFYHLKTAFSDLFFSWCSSKPPTKIIAIAKLSSFIPIYILKVVFPIYHSPDLCNVKILFLKIEKH